MKNWNEIIYLINAILSFSILILSINYHRKSDNHLSLYIGMAFGLFGITHLIVLYDAGFEHGEFITGIRLLAYSCVVLALVKLLKNTQKHKLLLAEKDRFKLLFTTSPDSVSISSFDLHNLIDSSKIDLKPSIINGVKMVNKRAPHSFLDSCNELTLKSSIIM